MSFRLRIFCAFLLFAAVLPARLKTDVVIMSNGDRLTGEIKGLDAGILKVDLPYVDGTLSVEWLKVARIESNQLFIVQAQDGSVYTGTLVTSPGETKKIQISEFEQSAALLEQTKVVKVEETSDRFYRRLTGEVSLGLVYSKGNNSTQNTFGSDVEYRRPGWGVSAGYSSNLSASSGANTSTRNQLDITGYRTMPWKNYFYGGLGSFMQSSVQGIRLQSTLGGGVGRYFKNTNRARISVLAGIAWQSTNYEPSAVPVANQQVAAGLIASEIRFFLFKKTNLTFRSYVVPAITGGGRIRFNTNASYYLKIYKNLSWNLSSYGNWDTKPPGNFSGSDYGYSLGLKWTFGYR